MLPARNAVRRGALHAARESAPGALLAILLNLDDAEARGEEAICQVLAAEPTRG